jgi:hypothetical protein
MVLAVAVSAVVGYLLLFALTISIGDLPAVLNARDAGGNEIPAATVARQRRLESGRE